MLNPAPSHLESDMSSSAKTAASIGFGAAGFSAKSERAETYKLQLEVLRKHGVKSIDKSRIYVGVHCVIIIMSRDSKTSFLLTDACEC